MEKAIKRINTILFIILFLAVARVYCETVTTCVQFQGVTVGNMIVQTDYWNEGQCPGTQCLSIDDRTGAWTVTSATYNCFPGVAAYPSILYGKAYGSASPHSDLPAQINTLKCVNSSWSFQPTDTGRWDAAYDIWLCKDNQCGPDGFPGGAEIMVWMDYRDTQGWQFDKGPVTLNGMGWEVWYWDTSVGGDRRNYVAYLAKTKTDTFKNLDLKKFLDDSQARGYIESSWYLYAVMAGVEIAKGGAPFTSKSFSVSVNKGYGARFACTPVPVTPTPTPDRIPDEIPPPP